MTCTLKNAFELGTSLAIADLFHLAWGKLLDHTHMAAGFVHIWLAGVISEQSMFQKRDSRNMESLV